MTLYFKITNSIETHGRVKYKKGLIKDPLPWNPDTDCVPGGIYFTTKEHICKFLNYGIWLREIQIPDDAKVSFGESKHKANKVIVGKRYDLRKVETWEYLVENGADIHTYDDVPLRVAALNGHLETVKFLVENGADIHTWNDYALRIAKAIGHLKIVNYLKSKGCK